MFPNNQPVVSQTTSISSPNSVPPANVSGENEENTNPILEKRKRKKTSSCSDDFVEINRPNKSLRWQCKHCKHDLAHNATGTSHLKTHLNNCIAKRLHDHKQKILNFQREGSSVELPLMLTPSGKYDTLKTREAISHWIMMHEHPFIICEEGFIFVIKTVNSEFMKIGRKTIKDDCMTIYNNEKKKMKD